MGADRAGRIVDDEDRRRDFRAEPLGVLTRQLLERGLQAGIDGQPQDRGIGGQPASQRGGTEYAQADEEDLAASEDVTGPTAEQ